MGLSNMLMKDFPYCSLHSTEIVRSESEMAIKLLTAFKESSEDGNSVTFPNVLEGIGVLKHTMEAKYMRLLYENYLKQRLKQVHLRIKETKKVLSSTYLEH